MSRAHSMQNLPTGARWGIYVALAVGFALACAFLADWQFTRGAERGAILERVERNYTADPVPLDTLLPVGGAFEIEDEWHPVTLSGRYLTDARLLARNRPQGGTSAYEVLVPFETVDGRIIVIDRGWVAPGANGTEPGAVPDAPGGDVEVVAWLRPGEALPRSGRSAPDGQVPTIHLPTIAAALGADRARVQTEVYGLMSTENPAPANQPNPLEPPSEDPGPHLSYAVQWILFAVMGFVFIGYVIRTERRRRLEDERGEKKSHSRRHDRDSLDEDAILDAADSLR